MRKCIIVSIVASLCLLTGPATADTLTSVTVTDFSSRLGQLWLPPTTLDGDPATFWVSSKTDAAPFVTYRMGDAAVALGDLTITNVPGTSYHALDTARILHSADGTNYTELGVFTFDHAVSGVTVIDFAGLNAQYVRIEPLTNYYYGTVLTIADHSGEVVPTWVVGYADAIFTTAGGFADAGEDIEVYDADDSAQEDVALDGSASEFPDGSITGYRWSIDGTEIATGVNPTVTLAVGVHEIVLTCDLSDGSTDSDTVVVTVVGTPQSFASAGDDIVVTDADQSGAESVTLDGSNSAWSTATWDWYEGDTHLGSGVTLNVDFAVGVHTVTLQCTDTSSHNDSDEVIVTVLDGSPKPPVADAGLDRTVENRAGGAGEPVALDGSGSLDYDGTIVSYVWSEAGVQIATGATPTVTLAVGVHTLTLTVTDDDAMTDDDEVVVTVVEYAGNQGDAPRVGAWEADHLFDDITAEDMAIIRSKKVLLASRSFGMNLIDGFTRLAGQNAMYQMNWTSRYNVLADGYDAIPEDVFDTYDFVEYLCTYWPHTTRCGEFDWLIRNRYHDDIDAAIIFFHTATDGTFATYRTVMDSLRLDYPDITFIYLTSGCSPLADAAANASSYRFCQDVLATYDGEQPIYDLNDILSTHADGSACVNGEGVPYMCPEFNPYPIEKPDDTHPNSAFSEERMGKAMLVLLKEIFIPDRIDGDANNDGHVNIDDFIILKQNYNTTSGATWEQGDFTGDGAVNIADFVLMKQNYGR